MGPILFIVLSFSIYKQINNQPNLPEAWQEIKHSFTGKQWWKFVAVLLLMLVNWGLEARKWQLLVRGIQKVSFLRAFRAIFTGQAIALNTLNGMGEYVGRVVYLDDGNRLRAIALSIVGSLSQIIVTMVLGVMGLFYLRFNILNSTHHLEGLNIFWLNGLMYALSFGAIAFVLIYFELSWITKVVEKIPFVAKYAFYIQKLEDFHWKELTRILLLSFIRYVVFVVQYLLLLQLFNVQAVWWQLAWMVCVLFLVLAVVPTIPIAELGLRGQASKQLFGLLSVNTLGIVFTAAAIWLINRVIPAIAGTLFILGLKIFKKNNKETDIQY
ncbi:MAG: flippase-like domain-containing protein [Chitinophagaceae bacterium]|nr:flippase-like domain-containing protein [Chitinophagaceae bacterium]